MVAARDARELAGFRYEEIIEAIDWNRVLIQAMGVHTEKVLNQLSDHGKGNIICGQCIKGVLLRHEEPTETIGTLIYEKIPEKDFDSVVYKGSQELHRTLSNVSGEVITVTEKDTPEYKLDRLESILKSYGFHEGDCPARQSTNNPSVYVYSGNECKCWLKDGE